jgi:hypothetical protein
MANPIAIPGSVVPTGSQVSPGGAQGVQGLTGPIAVSADSGNLATIGSDNLVLVPQSSIWNVRLRSFNAIGNPNFEVDQRNAKSAATATLTAQRTFAGNLPGGPTLNVPNTNFAISQGAIGVTLTTAQASLAASEYFIFQKAIEGPILRELINDVSSISLLVRSTVAPLTFAVSIRNTYSYVMSVTIPTANAWTLIPLPNIPIWPGAGNWSLAPGTIGYYIGICLACGSTNTASALNSWQSTNVFGAPGQSNFFNNPVNTTSFYCAFVQHEPGPACTQLIDKPFSQNLDECLRYFTKSYAYATKAGTVASTGAVAVTVTPSAHPIGHVPFKKTMAKVPTVTFYSSQTGTINAVYDVGASADRSISATNLPGDSGFAGVTLTALNTAATWYAYQYTADTAM